MAKREPELSLIPVGQDSIKLTPAVIEFPSYESILENATRVADQVLTVEVTEDNTKQSKKLLAAVRKEVQKLERSRIDLKKEILKPYQELEQQVKSITTVVDEAEQHLNNQLKELQEKERKEKEIRIRELFRQRIQAYDFQELVNEDNFIFPHYLNKTCTMTQVEKEMVEHLEAIHDCIVTIRVMENSQEILTEYVTHLDLPRAIREVKEREDRRKKVTEMVTDTTSPDTVRVFFVIEGEHQIKLTEMLLNQNNITFIKEIKWVYEKTLNWHTWSTRTTA